MPLLGAHMSIAGGYYKAVDAAAEFGMDVVQLFTKNNNQWRAKPITPAEAQQFRQALADRKISHPLSHACYLINLASPDEALWQKSVDAMVVELERATLLGIPYVVVHPGSHTTASEEEGLVNVARALDEIHRRLPAESAQALLENTAGQGTNLGWRFEHLAAILGRLAEPQWVGVCIDTCHAFAAGYDLREAAGFRAAFRELDQQVGLERVKAFHLNDSVKGLGSRVDRHAHIGHGQLGAGAFRLLLHDRRFRRVPMYLETPKEGGEDESWDAVNLRVLRELASD